MFTPAKPATLLVVTAVVAAVRPVRAVVAVPLMATIVVLPDVLVSVTRPAASAEAVTLLVPDTG